MIVKELKGFKSLRAFNAFHTLMLGLKMLPAYAGETYEEFFSRVDAMAPADQEKIVREAALFVELQKEEVEAIMCFVEDSNGVAYGSHNLSNMAPGEIIDAIVAVCMRLISMRIDIVSDAEKKNFRNSA